MEALPPIRTGNFIPILGPKPINCTCLSLDFNRPMSVPVAGTVRPLPGERLTLDEGLRPARYRAATKGSGLGHAKLAPVNFPATTTELRG